MFWSKNKIDEFQKEKAFENAAENLALYFIFGEKKMFDNYIQ